MRRIAVLMKDLTLYSLTISSHSSLRQRGNPRKTRDVTLAVRWEVPFQMEVGCHSMDGAVSVVDAVIFESFGNSGTETDSIPSFSPKISCTAVIVSSTMSFVTRSKVGEVSRSNKPWVYDPRTQGLRHLASCILYQVGVIKHLPMRLKSREVDEKVLMCSQLELSGEVSPLHTVANPSLKERLGLVPSSSAKRFGNRILGPLPVITWKPPVHCVRLAQWVHCLHCCTLTCSRPLLITLTPCHRKLVFADFLSRLMTGKSLLGCGSFDKRKYAILSSSAATESWTKIGVLSISCFRE